MYFTITSLICHLIFSINLSLETKLEDGRSRDRAENSIREILNETTNSDKFIKKSDLAELINLKKQYAVKNAIEDFETHWARHFQPDLSKLDQKSPPARQAVEIRRQKWKYIFDNLGGSYVIERLDSELQNASITRWIFCRGIAEAHFQLSCNGSVFHNELQTGNPLLMESVRVFMKFVSDLKLNPNQPDEVVQIPKSLYVKLLYKDADLKCKDVQVALMKKHHEDEIKNYENKILRLKNACREKVRRANEKETWERYHRVDSGSELLDY